MGRKPVSGARQETNTERTSRERDNKRRHRARQKEYLLDLERRVAETREQGVQVTKEVQLAARKVARENAKLKDLLRRTGYSDDFIDAWVREDRCLQGVGPLQLVLESTSGKCAQKAVSVSASESERERGLNGPNVSAKEGEPVLVKTCGSGKCLTKAFPTMQVESRNNNTEVSPTQVSTTTTSSSSPSDGVGAPCKLLSLLANNPAADITQVPLPKESQNPACKTSKPEDCSSGGMECATAYKTLMQYATSAEKMDRIAAALESGCTPSAGGGCKVKKDVIWALLDEECA